MNASKLLNVVFLIADQEVFLHLQQILRDFYEAVIGYSSRLFSVFQDKRFPARAR